MNVTVPALYEGSRLDVVLTALGPLSRSAVQKLITSDLVKVNGRTARKNDRVKAGDEICADIPAPAPLEAAPEDIALDILHEDADLLVLNKPKGMVVHPSPGHDGGTLVNALLAHCGDTLSGIGGIKRPGIVHRIDKDTSGLLLAAKTDFAHVALSEALKKREVARIYSCIAHGCPKQDDFTVNAPIGRHPVNRKKQTVLETGRSAVTHVRVLECYRGFSLLRCVLETGRTHQIRVHLAHIGHSVVGDALYGPAKPAVPGGQLLHAGELAFSHPRDGRKLRFTAPPPKEFTDFLAKLRTLDT